MSQKLEYENYKLPVVAISLAAPDKDGNRVFAVSVAPAYDREKVTRDMWGCRLSTASLATREGIGEVFGEMVHQIHETSAMLSRYYQNPDDSEFASDPYFKSEWFLSVINVMRPFIMLSGCKDRFWEMMAKKAVDQLEYTVRPEVFSYFWDAQPS